MNVEKYRLQIAAAAIVSTILTGGVVLAAVWGGTYSQSVNNTPPAAPAFAITNAIDSLGDVCTHTGTTASCGTASLIVGGSYTISITVTNSGTASGTVSVAGSTTSTGSIDSIAPAATAQSINAGSSGTFTLTVTSVAAGTDTVNIQLSG